MTQQEIDSLKQDLISLINSKLADVSTITASEHRDVENAIVNSIFTDKSLKGDIKEIACNDTYISTNFETNGFGKTTGERAGWAICNGQNGTINKMGRVAIGYDPTYYPMITSGLPTFGGFKEVQLSINQMPTHSHDIQFRRDSSGSGTGNYLTLSDTANSDEGAWGTEYGGNSTTGNARILDKGGNQVHPNMQPYIVTLFIQKIS